MSNRLQRWMLSNKEDLSDAQRILAIDIVQCLVGQLDGSGVQNNIDRVTQALTARTGMSKKAGEELISMVLHTDRTTVFDDFEAEVIESHFGTRAVALLRESSDLAMDLSGFANVHPPEDCLLLLDVLIGIMSKDKSTIQTGQLWSTAAELKIDPALHNSLLRKHSDQGDFQTMRFSLKGNRHLIGRSSVCAIILNSPQVDACHAWLVRADKKWQIKSLSARPTTVDGLAITTAPVDSKCAIQIGPYALKIEGETLVVNAEKSMRVLSVQGLNRTIGKTTLLNDIHFTVFSGELVALVGPSGSGKSTLLNAISGLYPADSGTVLLDGHRLQRLLETDPTIIGEVPQDDIVQSELTVEESLRYAGRLRMPAETNAATLSRAVERVLSELGIEHIRGNRIGNSTKRGISGGQRKRVNLGQELMSSSANVLFLDEPTSGLDARSADEITLLARQLADSGRIVFMVTHDVSAERLEQVDHLMVLDRGGEVAWFGPPSKAKKWFKVPHTEAIFSRLSDKTPQVWAEAYRNSPHARQYINTREHLLGVVNTRPKAAPAKRINHRQALLTLTSRYARVKFRDRTGLTVSIIQPLFIAAVMGIVFPRPTLGLLFMLTLSTLWFGMFSAVRELIVDQALWQRERRVGIAVLPYVLSRSLVQAILTALQSTVLVSMVYLGLDLGSAGFSLPMLLLGGVLTAWSGMTLGLMVSACWRSSTAAVGTLILLLIPQLAFSGILMPIGEMSTPARFLSHLTIQRYALDIALKCGETLDYLRMGTWFERPTSGVLFALGLRPEGADQVGLPLETLMFILVLFIGVQLACTWGLIARRD